MTHPQLPPDLADRVEPAPVIARSTRFEGRVWDVVTDEVDLGAGGQVTRDYVQHTGAVAVVALRGEAGSEEVLLIQQYRHPVGTYDWEIPAGLLDVAGEDPLAAAKRELAEEADLGAQQWHLLLDVFPSPGGLSENIRIFLACDTHPVTHDFVREGEEHEMPTGWLSLDAAADAALNGRIHNAVTIAGIFAALRARDNSFGGLRPADAAWATHPGYR